MSRTLKRFVILAWIFGSFWPSCALATNQIMGIRHWVAPDHTRVVIDTVDEATFSVEKGERKITIDLEDTSFPDHISQPILINKPGLEQVAITARAPSGVRVELALPAQVQTTVLKLNPFQDKPYRIVIDIALPEVARKESEARKRIKITRKDRIVVIDPGHGGEAIGAVGKKGTFEKDVVLSIGRKLQGVLNKRPGYRAFLTRDGDYYVSFRKRMMIAREYGADLFVSIHADAARNRMAGGSSVYCLSTGGASSEAAKILAKNENLADVVGGVPNGEGSEDSDPIILDMFQTNTINQSKTFGVSLLQYLQRENHLKFTNVQEAQFLVLKLPEIPSVLVETAYISNPKEEKLLNSARFQMRVARAIADSIGEFLPPLPLVAVSVEAAKEEKPKQKGQKEPDKAPPVEAISAVIAAKGEGAGRAADAEPVARKNELPPPVKTDESAPVARKNGLPPPVKTGTGPAADTDPAAEKNELPSPVKAVESTPVAKKNAPPPSVKMGGSPSLLTARKNALPKPAKTMESPAVREKAVFYRVQRGDTLEKIARKHSTSISVLLSLNHMKLRDPLYVHRRLKISEAAATPEKSGDRGVKAPVLEGKSLPAEKSKKVIYRVKKGDSLALIAKRHGTTVAALVKLNHLKPAAPLYVDRKLVISENPAL
ncbi:MAG: N-acetylmuramoyl-L-alanine amidase [Deltaproteobacteria bacterium]|nr:N-acetylmuramoyl-L-alanine amidase [Deltaproteobacteria bacterium]